MTENLERERDVSAILWLGLPMATLALKLLSPLLGPARWTGLMETELGFVENATVGFLIPAVVLSLLIFRRRRQLPRGFGWIMLVIALGSLFFAGEEISWGQHYLGFETPEALMEFNRQDEFNFHNTESKYGGNLLNNIPRQILNLAMVAWIVLPLVLHRRIYKSEAREKLWYWLTPNYRVIPIAVMAILFRIPDKIDKLLPEIPWESYLSMAFFRASGEFKEYCFAMAIMLYVLSIHARMRRRFRVLSGIS